MSKINNKIVKIRLTSFDSKIIDRNAKKIIEIIKSNGAKVRGPIPLPVKTEKFTVLRATHKFKDSREQFERRTYKRLIVVDNANKPLLSELSQLVLSAGVSVEIN